MKIQVVPVEIMNHKAKGLRKLAKKYAKEDKDNSKWVMQCMHQAQALEIMAKAHVMELDV